jgi:predicted amidohydrolase
MTRFMLKASLRNTRIDASLGGTFLRLRKIPVACVQVRAGARLEFEDRWPGVVSALRSSARSGAKLIVLPEATVPAYVLGQEPVDPVQIERARADVAAVARATGATIVYGTARCEDGQTYNSASVIGPAGDLLGFADKHFLWHFDRRWFARGSALEPIETPLGRLGVLVCADGRIPTLARTLVERGAEMLVMVTAWVTSGRDPANLENLQADLMVGVRARENGVPFLAANKCGVENGSVAYCGKSAILAADGTFVARAPQDAEATISGEVKVGAPAAQHSATLRPDAPPQPCREARIAFCAATDPATLERFAFAAAQADADLLLAPRAPEARPGLPASIATGRATGCTVAAGGVLVGIVDRTIVENPAGLVPARLAGVDLFVWNDAESTPESIALARTRAAELRAYVVALPGSGAGRAYAVDPDGTVVAGTFGEYRLATFGYDRARSGATAVAPHTDVLAGLRAVETVRETMWQTR